MKTEHMLLIIILIFVIVHNMATRDRDKEIIKELKEIKIHLELKQ